MTFSQKLKELRTEKNWKQDTLAKEINIDLRQISLYENDKNLPSIETVIKIAQVFNISIDYLLIDDYPRRPLHYKDNATVEKFNYMEILTEREKNAVFVILEELAYKNKIKNAIDIAK